MWFPQNVLSSSRSHDAICFLNNAGDLHYDDAYKSPGNSVCRVASPDAKKTTVAADFVALLTTVPPFRGGIEKAVTEAAKLSLDAEVLSCESCPSTVLGFITRPTRTLERS